jgi:uncharacterized membrane protein
MVLELRPPPSADVEALAPMIPAFLSYLLSFAFLAIYWNNHHHLLQTARHVTGAILWANMHLLFWLSLIPFVTNWMGDSHFAPWPVAIYGVVMILSAIAYYVLTRVLIMSHGAESALALAVGRDVKGLASLLLYALAIPLAFVYAYASCGLYVLVAVMWIIPDRRIERTLTKEHS